MEIYNFPGVIYATDGSKGSTGMGAGFYRHDTKGGGCCRVGGGVGGGSSDSPSPSPPLGAEGAGGVI